MNKNLLYVLQQPMYDADRHSDYHTPHPPIILIDKAKKDSGAIRAFLTA